MGPKPENGAISRRGATAIKALRVKALIAMRPALIRFRLWRINNTSRLDKMSSLS